MSRETEEMQGEMKKKKPAFFFPLSLSFSLPHFYFACLTAISRKKDFLFSAAAYLGIFALRASVYTYIVLCLERPYSIYDTRACRLTWMGKGGVGSHLGCVVKRPDGKVLYGKLMCALLHVN